jgi:hypothetical protein
MTWIAWHRFRLALQYYRSWLLVPLTPLPCQRARIVLPPGPKTIRLARAAGASGSPWRLVNHEILHSRPANGHATCFASGHANLPPCTEVYRASQPRFFLVKAQEKMRCLGRTIDRQPSRKGQSSPLWSCLNSGNQGTASSISDRTNPARLRELANRLFCGRTLTRRNGFV